MVSDRLEDQQLVGLVAGQDREAYATLVRRYGLRYRNLALGILNDVQLAEDIVQDAFLKLWTSSQTFNPDKASFTTWFHRLIVNRCIDEKRRKKPAELPDEYDLSDFRPGASEQLEKEQQLAAVMNMVGRLKPRQALAIILFHFDGLSMKDAATVMDTNPKAFESLLMRSREALKAKLQIDAGQTTGNQR